MKIAIPLHQRNLSMHFGHCEHFALVEVDDQNKTILSESLHEPPPHEPGLLPRWLSELGANLVIAGDMGRRAQELFASNDIGVLVGAQGTSAKQLVSAYLNGSLETGENCCDH
ncbi:MAG: ATPase [Desulfuromonadales bacterium C00003096]|jgi:predicted Fe-Mo cluster-binding NifX family protein|nr:MAG: ATPase [Desulfuromonadales bacterium C00003096]